MPESGEVRRTTDFLRKELEGRVITNWVFVGGGYTDKPPEGYGEMDAELPLVVERVGCKGKLIYFVLKKEKTNEEFCILHSMMTNGGWQKTYHDFCKWFVDTSDGRTLWFKDSRALATLEMSEGTERLEKKLAELGADVQTPEFSFDYFQNQVERFGKRNITSFVMDQSVIAGCGNIIKSEALYEACISPLRKIGTLGMDERKRLWQALVMIPREMYKRKWRFKAYGRKHLTRTTTTDGRTTYWSKFRQR